MTSHSLASMIVSHWDELSRDSKLNRETIIGNWIEEHVKQRDDEREKSLPTLEDIHKLWNKD